MRVSAPARSQRGRGRQAARGLLSERTRSFERPYARATDRRPSQSWRYSAPPLAQRFAIASASSRADDVLMFDEAQLYAPVTESDDGEVRVHLADDHPGADDPEYRARRDAIAARALGRSPGDPIPRIEYTEREHEVWRTISRELAAKHERLACDEFRHAAERLQMPVDHVPAARRGRRAADRADGVPLRAGGRRRRARRVLRRPRRRRLPLDAVPAPPLAAALHAGARRRPRADRPRQLACERTLRRALPPGRSARPGA